MSIAAEIWNAEFYFSNKMAVQGFITSEPTKPWVGLCKHLERKYFTKKINIKEQVGSEWT